MGKKIQKTVELKSFEADLIYQKLLQSWAKFLEKSPDWAKQCKLSEKPESKTLALTSPWATIQLQCLHEKVEIQGELSWMATPFHSQVEKAMNQWIEKNFPNNPVA